MFTPSPTSDSVGMFTADANAYMIRGLRVLLAEIAFDRSRLGDLTSSVEFDGRTHVFYDDDKVLDATLANARKLATVEGANVDFGEAYDTVVRESIAVRFEAELAA